MKIILLNQEDSIIIIKYYFLAKTGTYLYLDSSGKVIFDPSGEFQSLEEISKITLPKCKIIVIF
jgi:hypothetical protein